MSPSDNQSLDPSRRRHPDARVARRWPLRRSELELFLSTSRSQAPSKTSVVQSFQSTNSSAGTTDGELVGPMTGEPTLHAREPTSDAEELTSNGSGPVVFAYDGSERAKLAIEQAGKLLGTGRDAVVLTVWTPFDVGFVPAVGLRFDGADPKEVKQAAEQTAAEGASFAESVGFRARRLAVQSSPTWKGIVDLADDRGASLIVLGSHGRRGLARVLIGSVAEAVAAHSRRSVLITHRLFTTKLPTTPIASVRSPVRSDASEGAEP